MVTSLTNIKLESQYVKMLALSYNDKDLLISQLNKSINLYLYSKNPLHYKSIQRIFFYKSIIETTKKQQ